MQSSTETDVVAVVEEPAEAEPAPAPLILLEPLEGDSGVCAADGWCD